MLPHCKILINFEATVLTVWDRDLTSRFEIFSVMSNNEARPLLLPPQRQLPGNIVIRQIVVAVVVVVVVRLEAMLGNWLTGAITSHLLNAIGFNLLTYKR